MAIHLDFLVVDPGIHFPVVPFSPALHTPTPGTGHSFSRASHLTRLSVPGWVLEWGGGGALFMLHHVLRELVEVCGGEAALSTRIQVVHPRRYADTP